MVILQSHRTQNMILRCYPNVAICYTSETYQILSPVLFQQSLYFPLFTEFLFTCLCPFFTCFAVLEESIQAGALLRPKNGYLVWPRGASSACARMAPGRREYALCYSSQSMNSTTIAASNYTENIHIHLKLIFAFAAQSSLSKVRNDNV